MAEERSLRAKLLRGAKWSIGLRLIAQSFSWVVTLVMVRLLTPADYGLYSMLQACMEILLLLGTLSVDSAIIRLGLRDKERLASVFGYLLVTNGLIALGLFVGAPAISRYFNAPSLMPLVQLAAVVFLLVPFRVVPNALLDMNLDFKLRATIDLVATVVASLAGLLMAWNGFGAWALLSVVLIQAALKVVLLAWHRPWFVVPRFDLELLRPVVAYGATLALGTFFANLAGKVFSVLGGPSLGPEVLGVYAVAASLAVLPISKAMPIIQQTLYPAYSRLASDPTMVKKYLLHAVELAFISIVPIGLALAAAAPKLVDAVFGSRWQAAALPLVCLAALTPIRVLHQLLVAPLNATGHAKAVSMASVTNLVVLLAGVYLVLPYGVLGLVLLASFGICLQTSVTLTAARRHLGLRPSDLLGPLLKPIMVCAAMVVAMVVASEVSSEQRPSVALLACVVAGLTTYALALLGLMRNRLSHLWKLLRGTPKD